jgi:hypothetical protein
MGIQRQCFGYDWTTMNHRTLVNICSFRNLESETTVRLSTSVDRREGPTGSGHKTLNTLPFLKNLLGLFTTLNAAYPLIYNSFYYCKGGFPTGVEEFIRACCAFDPSTNLMSQMLISFSVESNATGRRVWSVICEGGLRRV